MFGQMIPAEAQHLEKGCGIAVVCRDGFGGGFGLAYDEYYGSDCRARPGFALLPRECW